MWTPTGVRLAIFITLLIALAHADKGGSGSYGNTKSKGKGKGGSQAYYAPQPHKVIIVPAGPSYQYGWVGFGGHSKKDKDKKIPRLPYVPFPAVIQKGHKYGSIIHQGDYYGGGHGYSAPAPQVYNYAPSYSPAAIPPTPYYPKPEPNPVYNVPATPVYQQQPPVYQQQQPVYQQQQPVYQQEPVYQQQQPVYQQQQPVYQQQQPVYQQQEPVYQQQPAANYAEQPIQKPVEEAAGSGVTVPPVTDIESDYSPETADDYVPVYIPETVKPTGPPSYEYQANSEISGQAGNDYTQQGYGEQIQPFPEQPQYFEAAEPRPLPESPFSGWSSDNSYQQGPQYRDVPLPAAEPEYNFVSPDATSAYIESPVNLPVYEEQGPASYQGNEYGQQQDGAGWAGENQWLQSTVRGSGEADSAGAWSQQTQQVASAPLDTTNQQAQAVQQYDASEPVYVAANSDSSVIIQELVDQQPEVAPENGSYGDKINPNQDGR